MILDRYQLVRSVRLEADLFSNATVRFLNCEVSTSFLAISGIFTCRGSSVSRSHLHCGTSVTLRGRSCNHNSFPSALEPTTLSLRTRPPCWIRILLPKFVISLIGVYCLLLCYVMLTDEFYVAQNNLASYCQIIDTTSKLTII